MPYVQISTALQMEEERDSEEEKDCNGERECVCKDALGI